jgi:hypothetical protein
VMTYALLWPRPKTLTTFVVLMPTHGTCRRTAAHWNLNDAGARLEAIALPPRLALPELGLRPGGFWRAGATSRRIANES